MVVKCRGILGGFDELVMKKVSAIIVVASFRVGGDGVGDDGEGANF